MGRLEVYLPVGRKQLRCGYTTGTCAAAAAAGAAARLLTGAVLDEVQVDTPAGVTVTAELLEHADLTAEDRDFLWRLQEDSGKEIAKVAQN